MPAAAPRPENGTCPRDEACNLGRAASTGSVNYAAQWAELLQPTRAVASSVSVKATAPAIGDALSINDGSRPRLGSTLIRGLSAASLSIKLVGPDRRSDITIGRGYKGIVAHSMDNRCPSPGLLVDK